MNFRATTSRFVGHVTMGCIAAYSVIVGLVILFLLYVVVAGGASAIWDWLDGGL